MNDISHQLKDTLVRHLNMGQAFTPVQRVLEKVSYDRIGERHESLPYSFFEIFYHIQYAQKDILDYCTDPNYEAPAWPDDYWPGRAAPADKKEWEALKNAYFETRTKLKDLLFSPERGLADMVHKPEDHSLFREVLLVVEHSAYHTGQLVLLARLAGMYK